MRKPLVRLVISVNAAGLLAIAAPAELVDIIVTERGVVEQPDLAKMSSMMA